MNISSTDVVSVCPGESASLICTVNRIHKQWNVTAFINGSAYSETYLLSYLRDYTNIQLTIPEIQQSFYITKTSSEPFTTILSVSNITADLNGSVINCTGIGRSIGEAISSVVTIRVLKTDRAYSKLLV